MGWFSSLLFIKQQYTGYNMTTSERLPNIKLATNGMRDGHDKKVLFKSSCFCTSVKAERLKAAPVKLSAGQKRLLSSYPQVRCRSR